jgi:prolipoprotein diacylglyceryltransferase
MTRGQLLCLPMIAFGLGLIVWGHTSARAKSEAGVISPGSAGQADSKDVK